jgi:hypothetical protein
MSKQLESMEEDGLLITYDEESSLITFEWNEKTHPQYNCLCGLTEEKFSQMLKEHCERLDALQETTDVQDRGPCSGTPESNCDPEPLT